MRPCYIILFQQEHVRQMVSNPFFKMKTWRMPRAK